VRAKLVARFSEGGRGFFPLGLPHKRLFQEGEAMTRASGFEPDEAGAGKHPPGLAGWYGPSGVAMDTRSGGAWMSSELVARAERYEIVYLGQPGGGSFNVLVDGKVQEHIATLSEHKATAYRSLAVSRTPHTLELKAAGDGPVRVFGVRLQDDAVGLTFDAFGINGAKAPVLLATDEAHFAEELEHAPPSLAIFAYGTNEAGDSTTTLEEHMRALKELSARVKKAAPGSSCLIFGPPDRASVLSRLLSLIDVQRRAAAEAGCAFFDSFTAMGGPGSIERWAKESPARARRDFVHLTRAGYATVAEAFVRDLFAAYDARVRDVPVK
jgi:lysophospholipase L1-like esterase